MFFNSLYRLARHAGKSPDEAQKWANFVVATLNGEETDAAVSSSRTGKSFRQFNNSTDVPFAQGFSGTNFPRFSRSSAPAISAISGD